MYYAARLTILSLFLTSMIFPVQAFAASSDDLLQCMADCIVQEGKSEAQTCKQRCSKIRIDMNQSQPRDCMATFKQCKRDCDKSDKACKKECKRDLLNCG